MNCIISPMGASVYSRGALCALLRATGSVGGLLPFVVFMVLLLFFIMSVGRASWLFDSSST